MNLSAIAGRFIGFKKQNGLILFDEVFLVCIAKSAVIGINISAVFKAVLENQMLHDVIVWMRINS